MARHTHFADTRPVPRGLSQFEAEKIMSHLRRPKPQKLEAVGRTIGLMPIGECLEQLSAALPGLSLKLNDDPAIRYITLGSKAPELQSHIRAQEVCIAIGHAAVYSSQILEATIRKFQAVGGLEPGSAELRITVNDVSNGERYIMADEAFAARWRIGVPGSMSECSPTNCPTYAVPIGTVTDLPSVKDLKSVCGEISAQITGNSILIGQVEQVMV